MKDVLIKWEKRRDEYGIILFVGNCQGSKVIDYVTTSTMAKSSEIIQNDINFIDTV
jgi:hypothetical protein